MIKLKSTTQQTLSLFWQHMWRYPRYVVGIAVAIPLTVLVEQSLPAIILANVLNRLAKGEFQAHHLMQDFGISLLAYSILLLCGTAGWRLIDAFNWRLEAGVERDLAQRIYSHLLGQSSNFHANTFGGSLVSQSNKLMSAYIRFADTTMYQVGQLFAGLIFTAIILAPKAPLFVAILLIFAALFMISGAFITRKVRVLTAKRAADESKQTGYLADSVTNIMAIKSFAAGHFERKSFKKITDTTHSDTMDVMRASQKQMAYFSVLSRVISISALASAIVGVVVFKANVATAFLIFTYTSSLIGQLWMFTNNALRNYNRAFGDASEMTEILGLEPEIKDPVNPEKVRIHEGNISFKAVDFTHDGSADAIFHKLNLEVGSGEKVGLVGHSGSGKTTFTRLLLRFSDIGGGEILIDGQNIANITQDNL